MRQSWTDDRLDNLSHRMDKRFDQVEGEMKTGFARVDGEIRALRSEMKAADGELRRGIQTLGKELRGEMGSLEGRLRAQASDHHAKTGEEFTQVREELAKVHSNHQQLIAEMQALQRTIIQIGWTGAIALVATVLGILATHL